MVLERRRLRGQRPRDGGMAARSWVQPLQSVQEASPGTTPSSLVVSAMSGLTRRVFRTGRARVTGALVLSMVAVCLNQGIEQR